MRTLLAGLTSVVVLTLSLVACTGCPLTPGGPSGMKVGQVELRGELGYYRHLDPVTGQGAVSLRAAGQETWLDLREFRRDVVLQHGTYVIKGHWGQEHRLVVTAADPFELR